MNSNDYSAPPSFSSGNLRSNEPWLATYDQPTGHNPTQPPSISSAGLRNFQRNVLTDDQYIAAEDYNGQAPSYSAFQHGGGNSINQFTNENGYYRGGYQTNDGVQAPDFDAFERQNNSGTTGFNVYNGYEQAPSYSGVAPRNPSIPGVVPNDNGNMNMNLGDNVGISLVGRNFQRAKLMELYKDRDMY